MGGRWLNKIKAKKTERPFATKSYHLSLMLGSHRTCEGIVLECWMVWMCSHNTRVYSETEACNFSEKYRLLHLMLLDLNLRPTSRKALVRLFREVKSQFPFLVSQKLAHEEPRRVFEGGWTIVRAQ